MKPLQNIKSEGVFLIKNRFKNRMKRFLLYSTGCIKTYIIIQIEVDQICFQTN